MLWERERTPLTDADNRSLFGGIPDHIGGNTVNAQAQNIRGDYSVVLVKGQRCQSSPKFSV